MVARFMRIQRKHILLYCTIECLEYPVRCAIKWEACTVQFTPSQPYSNSPVKLGKIGDNTVKNSNSKYNKRYHFLKTPLVGGISYGFVARKQLYSGIFLTYWTLAR